MRAAFVRTLVELAKADRRIYLVVGDLGFGVVTPFAESFPDRFVNAGVAEQNMTGLAAGLALTGKIVFTYSIGNFPTLRCIEQIRNDVCYHNANVKIVSVGAGVAYGAVGPTHHATEDLAIMRALPNMTVVAPCDPVEAARATSGLAALPGPGYLRLGRSGEAKVHTADVDFRIGKAIRLREGKDLTFIATGSMVAGAMELAGRLAAQGIEARVLSMHTIAPLDTQAVLEAALDTRALVTLEEHSLVGGLGSAVAESLVDRGVCHVPVKRLGLPRAFTSVVGSQSFLWEQYGLSVEGLLTAVLDFLRENGHQA